MFSIAGFVGAVLWSRDYMYPHIKDQASCANKSRQVNSKNPKDCAVWDDDLCRKGQIKGGNCESKGHVGPLLISVLAILLFIGFVVTLVMNLKARHQKMA